MECPFFWRMAYIKGINKIIFYNASYCFLELSAFFAVVGVALSGILYAVKADMNAVLLLFFVYAGAAIAAILVLPVRLSKK